ncbi:CBS domain-containing protein [Ilumatobacter sp.]|uniref:CBS domain-containing protein n=1 Tax=Ilumatobacter sp. TaxID=1967498 RepID=UPI003B52FE06
MNVQTILSAKGSDVATIDPAATLADAVSTLRERGFGALVASADGTSLDGIVSERDIVRSLAVDGPAALDTTVSTVMSVEVITCRSSDRIESLMSMMTERRIRHLPVVDDGGAISGMISIGDVVKFRLQQLEQENSQLHDYIQGNVG